MKHYSFNYIYSYIFIVSCFRMSAKQGKHFCYSSYLSIYSLFLEVNNTKIACHVSKEIDSTGPEHSPIMENNISYWPVLTFRTHSINFPINPISDYILYQLWLRGVGSIQITMIKHQSKGINKNRELNYNWQCFHNHRYRIVLDIKKLIGLFWQIRFKNSTTLWYN